MMYFGNAAQLGSMQLKNRFIMAPIKTAYGTLEGRVTDRHLRYYENVARGGVAMVVLEPVAVMQSGMEHPKQLTIHRDHSVADLTEIVDLLHRHEVRACLNLNHAGRAANPKATTSTPLAPSALPCPTTGQAAESLDGDRIREIIESFGSGVERAKEAGFDAVEIQCGHGYLISQFLSPRTNQRRDEYGRNRRLFLQQVLETVAAHRGGMTVILRISTSEFIEGGLTPAENAPVLELASTLGFDAIHCGMGNACDSPPFYYAHMAIPEKGQLEALREIRAMTELPLIAAGRMAEPEKLALLEEEKLADFVAFGRAIVADPQLPGKLIEGREDEITWCGFCLQACLAGVKRGSGLGCIVNPLIDEPPLDPAALKGRRIGVVGSGPAGLAAACTCAEMGAELCLFEKRPELGGQFRLAPLAPHKEKMFRPLKALIRRVERLVPEIRPGIEPGVEDLRSFDHVFVATGSRQRRVEIEGLESQYLLTSLEFFEDSSRVRGPRVLIIGAGMVGMEAAEWLIEHGFEVTATKRTDTIANDMEMITRKMMLKRLSVRPEMKIMPETTVLRFEQNGVRVRVKEAEKLLEPFDTVILAAGMEAEIGLAGELESAGLPFSVIGDALKPADIFSATQAGYREALALAGKIPER